jgi:hypothetical protein
MHGIVLSATVALLLNGRQHFKTYLFKELLSLLSAYSFVDLVFLLLDYHMRIIWIIYDNSGCLNQSSVYEIVWKYRGNSVWMLRGRKHIMIDEFSMS